MLGNLQHLSRHIGAGFVAISAVILAASAVHAQEKNPLSEPTYADLVAFSDPAEIVLKAQIRKQATVEPERSPGLAPGHVRLYIEAETLALISGAVPIGESLRYLVDVPLTAKGKAPKLKKADVLLFARPVTGRPGAIQLVSQTAQLPWSQETEARLRPILANLLSEDAPPAVTGVRDALSISGNLVGESETQIFLETADKTPLSISIIRRPGQAPVWGVSWSDIVDQAARPPAPLSLEWYRLACFLPPVIENKAMLTNDPDSRARTRDDYAFVRQQLGACERNLTG